MDDQQRLDALIASGCACFSIVTLEEEHALNLLRSAAMGAGMNVVVWSAVAGVRVGLLEDAYSVPETENAAAALYYFMQQVHRPTLCVMLDLHPHLEDARIERALREAIHAFRERSGAIAIIDTDEVLPRSVQHLVNRIEVGPPDENELRKLVKATLRAIHRKRNIEVRITGRDLDTVVRNLAGLTRAQAEQIIAECVATDRQFTPKDINHIVASKRQRLHRDGALQYIEAPVNLDSIGGLRRLKAWLKRREGSFDDNAAAYGLTPPRGVLLLGVQGAGKSLSAKAIAAAWQRPLLRLDAGSLYDRYVGESERRLREALHQAELMAPIVLWIDEIEKAFASAAAQSTDGGLSQRMFGTLLTWMQDHTAPVFLVATANNIQALPPELLRKGRFDEIFFVDLPREDVRREILAIHLRKRRQDPDAFDLADLARRSEGFSGAELEQAVISALHAAFAKRTTLTDAMLVEAIDSSPPLAVTMAERIDRLRAWAQDRCVPAD